MTFLKKVFFATALLSLSIISMQSYVEEFILLWSCENHFRTQRFTKSFQEDFFFSKLTKDSTLQEETCPNLNLFRSNVQKHFIILTLLAAFSILCRAKQQKRNKRRKTVKCKLYSHKKG